MLKRSIAPIILVIFFALPLAAQFGNLGNRLKEKAGELIKEQVVEQTDEKRGEYDTTSFTYAIAFLDKSEAFGNQQKGEGLVKAANFLIKDESEKSEREKARDLYEFGRINYVKRSYKLGEVYLLGAMVAYESLSATDDPVYLKTLGLLGLLYSDMGRFEKAEKFMQSALSGWENSFGKTSKGYAAEYSNMAVLKFNKGEYNKAEKELKTAGELLRKAEGEKSVPYAISLNNLGILYQYMGRSEDALQLVDQCLDVADKEFGKRAGTYLQLMTNKALVLQESGAYQEAEAVYKQLIDLQSSRLKLNRKSDPDYAHMLNNLASLYMKTERVEEAEDLLKESLEIYQNKFGDNHPLTASAQSDLGNLYRYSGRFEEAEGLLEKSLKVKKEKLGPSHPNTIDGLEDLAIVKWKKGDIEAAKTFYHEVMESSLSFINEFFAPLSEVEKTKYWEKLKPRFFTYYNFVFEQADEHPDLLAAAFNYRLATKGLLLNASTKIKNTILSGEDEELIGLYNIWQDQKRILATYYSFSKEEIKEQKVNIDSLERAANDTEKKLSESSAAFAEAFVSRKKDFREIQKVLKKGEALVELVQYPVFENSLTTDSKYAALILKGEEQDPELVLIENGSELDSRYQALYKNLIKQKVKDEYSYPQFWEPIANNMKGIPVVYVSPDGVYNQINLNTLKKPDGAYLIEEKDIHIIGSPTDLLALQTDKKMSPSAFLLGFPSYGSADIVPLPGTKREVEGIREALAANSYKTTMHLQEKATEKVLKEVHGNQIMHIATHGYFMEDIPSTGNVFGVQIEYARHNPLLRSGLLLAGASEDSGQSFDEEDNGVLTAYEAMNLDLNGTDLVVLSACETGKGDVKAGEGVYGLQRAFMVAGAGRLVMSLWKVDDEATQSLMRSFYDLWIVKKMSPEAAFRQAQITLMKTHSDPHFWGAFVMVE